MFFIIISLALLNIFCSAQNINQNVPVHPDFGLNIIEYLNKYHYPLESHAVKTEDGYLLTLHRVPYGRDKEQFANESKPVVLFSSGLYGSSMDWIFTGPKNSLALQLVELGYDIWLFNPRGNLWSRNHTTLNPDDYNGTFWDFSFHEIGYYDLPATIDYILNVTNKEKITYVGISQGSTTSTILASTRPEYNDKLNLIVSFAPIVYMQNSTGPLLKLAKRLESLIYLALDLVPIKEIPYMKDLKYLAKYFCNEESQILDLCADLIFIGAGFDDEQLNKSMLTVMFSNIPAGGSMKCAIHYLQFLETEYFRQYDYGPIKNMEIYKQLTPPNYDISKITAAVALYHAQNDFLSSIPDVMRLAGQLKNLAKRKLVDWTKFNHVDFIIAIDVNELLNKDVIALINKYNIIK